MSMKTFHDSTETSSARQQVYQLARLRMEVFAHNLAAVLVLGGAVYLAWYLASWYPLAFLSVAGYMALKARFLADGLPPRDTPSWQRRFALWLSDAMLRRRMARAAKPKPPPYRHVKVPGSDEPVKVPLAPGEARRDKENLVIYDLTIADVFFVVVRAYQVGLSERATDEYGIPVWRWEEGRQLGLPSGRHLSRESFRAVQRWLVKNGFAWNKPSYAFKAGFEPDQVLDLLQP